MPLLEVILVGEGEREVQAFVEEAHRIFKEVLGTPEGRLRVAVYPLPDPLEEEPGEG